MKQLKLKMSCLRIILLIIITVFSISLYSQSYSKIPPVNGIEQFRQGVARTAWLLTSSTQNQPKEVRILVYGQSISAQEWWKDVKDFVEKKFPYAHIQFINKAIGGFSTDRLKLMVANDVISFYPDLILFHDYGNEADYETIIQTIRSITTSEIAIQTDHMAVQNQEWHDRHNEIWLPALCKKYGLALIDIRSTWKAYLKENNLQLQDLLRDGVHLNRQGNYLMAAIIEKYFENLSPAAYHDTYVQTLVAGKDFKVQNNQLSIPVNGNRIDVIWKVIKSDAAPVTIQIDNGYPKNGACCFYYTRPSLDTNAFFLKRIGQLLAMQLTNKAREETWMLKVTAVDSVHQQIQFSLQGSITGEDGKGRSDTVFTSRSGKVIIQPEYWFRRRDANDFAQFQWLQPGDVLLWQIRPMCYDKIQTLSDVTITIAQGLLNGKHEVQLSGKGVNDIKEMKVYRPPLK